MNTYETLLFDVDDTLLDFGAAEKNALRLLFQEQQIPLTIEIEQRYRTLNQELWARFEQGKIQRDEVVNTRFSTLFKEYDKHVDGYFFEQKYRYYLNEGNQLINGAFELIKNLHCSYDLYIVTNGVSTTQYKRLKDSGLFPMFKDIFVSEDIGYQKPMKEYFDYVIEHIPNFTIEKALIIGDSLTSDIKGGHLAGIDTCWYNPKRGASHSNIQPNYQIHQLDDLYTILGQ
ncbi:MULTISPECIES: YjjG family noncanonical pyrimidine nucleotidase [Bacillus]|uniref:YjjG family noncanonical pyrimidine nucleotidase n=1 Tax=Bacillus TaxID=1386 RepID=UPI00030AA6DE|nr:MULTISPECIES: YjjG family noncanonical pyrimidine nucleotidase [Bacillus]